MYTAVWSSTLYLPNDIVCTWRLPLWRLAWQVCYDYKYVPKRMCTWYSYAMINWLHSYSWTWNNNRYTSYIASNDKFLTYPSPIRSNLVAWTWRSHCFCAVQVGRYTTVCLCATMRIGPDWKRSSRRVPWIRWPNDVPGRRPRAANPFSAYWERCCGRTARARIHHPRSSTIVWDGNECFGSTRASVRMICSKTSRF